MWHSIPDMNFLMNSVRFAFSAFTDRDETHLYILYQKALPDDLSFVRHSSLGVVSRGAIEICNYYLNSTSQIVSLVKQKGDFIIFLVEELKMYFSS